jgi:hypothetical protein
VALALASTLTIVTDGTVEQGLRYLAATCLLISLSSAALAIAWQDAAHAKTAEWEQALIFSLIAAGAHFLAGIMN